jgi:hypothetical protein
MKRHKSVQQIYQNKEDQSDQCFSKQSKSHEVKIR